MYLVGSDEEDSSDERCGSSQSDRSGRRKISIGEEWEAVGPFPSGMREHPLMASPMHAFGGFDVDPDTVFADSRYDESETWPSELGTGGKIGWKRFKRGKDGWTDVSYPDINWNQLREDRGWASLQYQTILRTSLDIPASSPSIPASSSSRGVNLRIDARQATEYAILPRDPLLRLEEPLIWYQGDLYDYAGSRPGQRDIHGSTSNFARSISLLPGEYVLLVRAHYEVRLFGDPGARPPTIRFKVDIKRDKVNGVAVVGGLQIVPHLVDGMFMGRYISFGLRVPAGSSPVTVEDISLTEEVHHLKVDLVEKTRIQPGQLRMVVVAIHQDIPIDIDELDLRISYCHGTDESLRSHVISIPIQKIPQGDRPFNITFPSATNLVSGLPAQIGYAVVVPPSTSDQRTTAADVPVILALHGAGVDVEWGSWAEAIPYTGGWSVLPTGKNEWGEDWHGGSMADAWAARDSLSDLVGKLGLKVSDKTLLLGHSNGGQGAWHLATHYPDKVVGVIAAAGYTKIQDYVPYCELTSAHYADPALMGILMASLAPYANDLHLSNLVHIPCLALHGGSDSNVPPRHSRSYASIIASWQHNKSAIEVVEVPERDHWWDGMFKHPQVMGFIDKVCRSPIRTWENDRNHGYTLTCTIPEECGGRAGIRIVELDTPGRIARLDVNAPHWRKGGPVEGLDLRGMNVKRIEVNANGNVQCLEKNKDGSFVASNQYRARACGPIIRILASSGPLHFIVGSDPSHLKLATRLCHDVFVHHRIDCTILRDREALQMVAEENIQGNTVVIGRPEENAYADWLVRQKFIPLAFPTEGILEVSDKLVYEEGSGIISLLPHPLNPGGLSMLIAGNDSKGMETAARLFPIRTGVPIPDWVVVGPRMAWQAAGGIIGAGFWGRQWEYNPAMSWFDR